MPEVDCLSVDDGVIHIRSIELLCQHPAEEVPRNIGTYNLVIRTQDGKASLRVFSRSGGINVDGLSLQAPQIGGDGNISCDWALQLGAYLTRGDLASFLRMVFHHLTTVQPDSFEAGVLESYYPKVA